MPPNADFKWNKFCKLTLESGVDDSISLESRHEDIEAPEKDKDPGSDSLYWFGSTLKEEEKNVWCNAQIDQ